MYEPMPPKAYIQIKMATKSLRGEIISEIIISLNTHFSALGFVNGTLTIKLYVIIYIKCT